MVSEYLPCREKGISKVPEVPQSRVRILPTFWVQGNSWYATDTATMWKNTVSIFCLAPATSHYCSVNPVISLSIANTALKYRRSGSLQVQYAWRHFLLPVLTRGMCSIKRPFWRKMYSKLTFGPLCLGFVGGGLFYFIRLPWFGTSYDTGNPTLR